MRLDIYYPANINCKKETKPGPHVFS